MLNCFINDYPLYCKILALSKNSIKELLRRVNQLEFYPGNDNIEKTNQIQYKHLVNLLFPVTPISQPLKRGGAMKKFFAFLLLYDHIKYNPQKGNFPFIRN